MCGDSGQRGHVQAVGYLQQPIDTMVAASVDLLSIQPMHNFEKYSDYKSYLLNTAYTSHCYDSIFRFEPSKKWMRSIPLVLYQLRLETICKANLSNSGARRMRDGKIFFYFQI